MSIRTKEKKLKAKSTVESKYFSSEPQQMDESLSEFKTPKKKVVAPNTDKALKSKKPAAKPTKKRTVKSKGQKDIRVALKSQGNELESHGTDLKNVCTENRVDVDPEHLQLAIALSRSLHEFHGASSQENIEFSCEPSAGSSQNLDDLSQTSRIRKALEEYGFIFPTSNTTRNKNQDVSKRKPTGRRRKKSSILLKITPQERKEKVAQKVSKVLLSTSNNLSEATSDVHHIATIQYLTDSQCSKSITERNTSAYIDVLQNDREFYVNNIVEESKIKVGCLLRDWSAIPGREKSPEREINIGIRPFQEYIRNQLDLDTLLSGILKKCTFDVIDCVRDDTNHSLITQESLVYKKVPDCHLPTDHVIENSSLQNDLYLPENTSNGFIIPENQKDVLEIPKPREVRSYSPDIFDDDENYDARHETSLPEPHYENIPESMLNQCPTNNEFTPICYRKTVSYEVSQRRSNDYMDLTECIPTYIKDKSVIANEILCIDNISVDLTTVEKNQDNYISRKKLEDIDLTQSFGGSQTLLGNQEKADVEKKQNNKLYSDEIQCKSNSLSVDEKVVDNFDLTLPSQHTLSTQSSSHSLNLSAENHTIYDLETEESDQMRNSFHPEELNNKSIDLTQNFSPETQNNQETSLVYDPIDDPNNITDLTQCYNGEMENIEQSNIDINFVCIDNESIDITQSSNEEQFGSEESLCKNESLAKNCEDILVKKSNDDICKSFEGNSSICNNLDKSNQSLIRSKRDENTSVKTNETFKNNSENSLLKNSSTDRNVREDNESSFSSQNSICNVFDISDEELDYSMQHYKDVKEKSKSIHNSDDDSMVLIHKRCTEVIKSAQTSKMCNFDIGGSSIFDGISINSDENSSNTDYKLVISNGKDSSQVFNDKSRSHDVTGSSLFLPDVKLKGIECVQSIEKKSPIKDTFPKGKNDFTEFRAMNNFSTPKSYKVNVISNVTPCNNQYMVRMEQITPMMDYRNMSSPDRNSELEKYGIKPFKRKRAVQILEHIYYQTHPTIDGNEELADSVCRSLKRRRLSESAVNNSLEVTNTSPVSSQKYQKDKGVLNLNFDSKKSSALNCCAEKNTAKRSFQKSISENNFVNRPSCVMCDEFQTNIVNVDFLADNSIKHGKNKKINCKDFGMKIKSNFSPKKNKDKEIFGPKMNKNESKPDNLEVQNDNLFDELIFGNKAIGSTGTSSSIISPRKNKTVKNDKGVENVNDLQDFNSQNAILENIENNDVVYPVTNWKPVLKEIDCESCDWVFQKREKAKVSGCRVPLHIAFHNYVNARPKLWAAILRYEPINIDAVHKGLLEDGYRYDAKDILRFMDKKCITVKTFDNDVRNANHQKKPKLTNATKK